MSYRVRLNIKWVVTYGFEGTPFSKDEDFYAYARAHLCECFKNYKPEISITKTIDFSGVMAEFAIVWDVNLDGVPGAWFNPTDHARLAEVVLKEKIRGFANTAKVDILRHPTENDPDGATDFVAWDPEFRNRAYAAFKARLDAEDAAAAVAVQG
jgi:hypothetical protein